MEGHSESEFISDEETALQVTSEPSLKKEKTASLIKNASYVPESFERITEAPAIQEKSLSEAEQSCEEIIQSLVDPGTTEEKKTSVESQTAHDPECPMYEESTKEPSIQSIQEDEPCPPGVRKCCTCGVCPLDIKEASEKEEEKKVESIGSDERSEESRKEGSEKSKESEKEEEKEDIDESDKYSSRTSTTDQSTIYDWDYSDGVSGSWDGEAWVRHHKYRKHKKIDQIKLSAKRKETKKGVYYMSPVGSERSRHEGSFVEDYMKFFVEPLEVCYKTLSSVSSSYVSCEEIGLQRTIVIVKPHAVQYKEVIYRVIFESGFQILGVRVLHLTPEQVSEIYAKYYGSPSFVHLVVSVSDAPLLAICITAMNVIKRWLKLIGPDGCLRAEWFFPLSMRKLFGLQPMHADWIHGSENQKESNKENRYFYPNAIIEPIAQDLDKVTDYCQLNLNKSIVEACVEVVKKRPADPIIFFADYLLLHNPFQPRLPTNIAFTPT